MNYEDDKNDKKVFYLEISAIIEHKCEGFPEKDILADLEQEIRYKVFCKKEEFELVEIASKIFEGGNSCNEDKF